MINWFPFRHNASEPIASIKELRERLLNPLLITGTLVGTVLLALALIPAFQKGLSILTIVYGVIYLWLLLITFIRRVHYMVRAISMLLFMYALGILNLATSGLNVDAGLFFLGLITMTALLIGLRAGIGAMVVSGITIAIFGFFIITGNMNLGLELNQTDTMLWVIGGTILLMLGLILNISMMVLIHGLQSNLDSSVQLTNQLESEQVNLRERSQDLERRSSQIHTAAEITRIISAVLDPASLPQRVADLLKDRFGLYFVGIFLLDERSNYAILRAGTGEAGGKLLAENYRFVMGEASSVGLVIASRQARIVQINPEEASAPVNPSLPLTRSEVVLPIISSDRVLGAVSIQSEKPAAFDEDDLAVFQGITDTLAIALENARLFQETQRNLDELRATQRSYIAGAWLETSKEQNEYEFVSDTSTPQESPEQPNAISVPLTLREQIIGQINLEGEQDWTPEERTLIEAVATQAALAMENARLLEESRQMALRERLAAEIIGKIWSSPNVDNILQTAIKELGKALHVDEGTIELKMD